MTCRCQWGLDAISYNPSVNIINFTISSCDHYLSQLCSLYSDFVNFSFEQGSWFWKSIAIGLRDWQTRCCNVCAGFPALSAIYQRMFLVEGWIFHYQHRIHVHISIVARKAREKGWHILLWHFQAAYVSSELIVRHNNQKWATVTAWFRGKNSHVGKVCPDSVIFFFSFLFLVQSHRRFGMEVMNGMSPEFALYHFQFWFFRQRCCLCHAECSRLAWGTLIVCKFPVHITLARKERADEIPSNVDRRKLPAVSINPDLILNLCIVT